MSCVDAWLLGLSWCAMVGLATVLVAHRADPTCSGNHCVSSCDHSAICHRVRSISRLTPEHVDDRLGDERWRCRPRPVDACRSICSSWSSARASQTGVTPMEPLGPGGVSLHVSEAAGVADLSGYHADGFRSAGGDPRGGARASHLAIWRSSISSQTILACRDARRKVGEIFRLCQARRCTSACGPTCP